MFIGMRWTPIIALMAIFSCIYAKDNEWSWGQQSDQQTAETGKEVNEESPDFEESPQANSTVAEQIIDEIISSTRQGRNVDGLDEVYSDPTVQDALQKGDDTEARNIIKDRLCYLGLMQVSL